MFGYKILETNQDIYYNNNRKKALLKIRQSFAKNKGVTKNGHSSIKIWRNLRSRQY